MALELESAIMTEIGLGMSYQWSNGSGSCEYMRQHAARELPSVIQKHHNAGEKIVKPDSNLMALMEQATRWDEDRYTLTIAWQVASYVIAAHIHAAYQPEEQRSGYLSKQEREIRRYCQPTRPASRYDNSWSKWSK